MADESAKTRDPEDAEKNIGDIKKNLEVEIIFLC